MLGVLLAHLMLLGQVAGSAPTTTEVKLTASTQPANQPVVVLRAQDSSGDGVLEVFGNTRLAKIARGEESGLTWDEVQKANFWVEIVKELTLAAVGFVPRLIVAVAFFIFFWIVYRGVRRITIGSMERTHVDPSIRDMLGHLLKWAILGFGLVIAFNQIGIQIMALLTGVSILGLAIGFAAQETLANFIAGIVIFWDKPFKVGDWVEVEGTFGEVQRVTFRSTRILDTQGAVIILPNTHMLSGKLANHSVNPINKVTIPIGIAYKESIDAARKVLLALAKDDDRICKEPPPTVLVKECADSSVNLLFGFWICDESIERMIYFEYMEKAKKALDAAGISIPFPHLQLLLEQTPAVTALAGNGAGSVL